MKSLSKLFAVFGLGIDKKINQYLITNNIEELKQIDRKSFLKAIYKTGKQIVIAENKLDAHKDNTKKLKNRLETTLEQISNSNSRDDIVKLERSVTLCERLKEQLKLADEVTATMKLTIDNLQVRLDSLISTINDYDALIEYQASIIELNKAKLELSKMKSDNINNTSTLAGDMKVVATELDTEVKTQQLIDSKMNNEPTVNSNAQSLEDRIAALVN